LYGRCRSDYFKVAFYFQYHQNIRGHIPDLHGNKIVLGEAIQSKCRRKSKNKEFIGLGGYKVGVSNQYIESQSHPVFSGIILHGYWTPGARHSKNYNIPYYDINRYHMVYHRSISIFTQLGENKISEVRESNQCLIRRAIDYPRDNRHHP